MHRKFLAGMLVGSSVLLVAQRSDAQFFGSSFGSSNYVDRIVQDAVSPVKKAPGRTAPAETPGPGEPAATATADGLPPDTAAEQEAFFQRKLVSLTYEYSHRNYSAPFNDLHTDLHLVLPELHLKSGNGFSLDLSAAYARSDAQDQSTNVVDSDTFALSVAPALELLGRGRDRCDLENPQLTFLSPGLAVGYRHTDLQSAFGGPSTVSNFESLILIPNVVFTQVVSKQAVVSAIAAYAYETSTSDSRDFLANDGSDGVVSIAARGDLSLPHLPVPCVKDTTTVAHLSGTVQWKHYTQASVRSVEGDDSAEFSANLTIPIPFVETAWTARVGYAYEAFREDYDAHRAQLYVEGPLWTR